MRVAVIINMIAPYQVPVFERLAGRPDVDLLVLYETEVESNRQWRPPLELPYEHVVLDSWSLDLAWLAVGSGTKLVSDIYVHIPKHPLAALTRFKPDAVVASGGTIWASPANIVALARRNRHGWAFVPRWETHSRRKPTLPRRVADPWVRRFFRLGDAWLAVGSRSARDLIRMGVDPKRIFIWPMVALPSGGDYPRPRAGEQRRPTRYLFVGQLIERKGIPELLAAFSQIEGGELWLIGDGPLRSEIQAAMRSDPRIRWHGHLDWEATSELYRSADIVVLPSRYETWGLVVNEALAHGLPIITTTEVGAVDDLIVRDVNGVVIPPRDVEALARAMCSVAEWSPRRLAAGVETSDRALAGWTFERAADSIAEACAIGIESRRLARDPSAQESPVRRVD
jgi:glycosyltransferase involved in cell wall biosynthesis